MRQIGPVGAIPSKWCGTGTLKLQTSWFVRWKVAAQGSTWKGQLMLARSCSMWGLMFPDGTISQGVSDHLLHLVMTRQLRNMARCGRDYQTVPEPCCAPRVDHSPVFLSRVARSRGIPRLTHRCFAPFSFAVCGFLFPRPAVFAGVAIHSIPVATTEQHALWLGFLGVVGSLWSLLQRVCAVVTTNMRIQDMDIVVPNQLDERRIEVLADGLPLFHGAQVVVDTTLVSALRRDGAPHPRCADVDRAALEAARRRKSSGIPSSLADRPEHDLLSWQQKWGEGGLRRLHTFSCTWPKPKSVTSP